MAVSHFTLHGRHPAGEITTPITRAEAQALFTKWARTALRKSVKGHRTLFLMHAHRGRCYDRLVIETTHARLRRHTAAQAHAEDHKKWVTR